MKKMPPMEKIPEAFSAIADGRVHLADHEALVDSSDHMKTYLVRWHGHTFYSNDNASYWQGYPGYPVLAVLMCSGELPYNEDLAKCFRGINWHQLNKQAKRDYDQVLENVLKPMKNKETLKSEIERVYRALEAMDDLVITRKKKP